MHYLTFIDKTIIFSYVNGFSVPLQIFRGEGLQWGGGGGQQYNTGWATLHTQPIVIH